MRPLPRFEAQLLPGVFFDLWHSRIASGYASVLGWAWSLSSPFPLGFGWALCARCPSSLFGGGVGFPDSLLIIPTWYPTWVPCCGTSARLLNLREDSCPASAGVVESSRFPTSWIGTRSWSFDLLSLLLVPGEMLVKLDDARVDPALSLGRWRDACLPRAASGWRVAGLTRCRSGQITLPSARAPF